jgi:LacI family transcriptional regulator
LARVRAVMQRHNYTPRPLQHRRREKIRESQARRIGVWFVGAKAGNASLNWFQDQLLRAQASDPRYQVDLRILFSNTADEIPRNLRAERLDGVIIQGMEPSPSALAKLRQLPHVWFMTRRSAGFPGDYIEPNNQENGRLAAEYLHSRGHRSVAVISTDVEYSAIDQRIRAFTSAAQELGLSAHSILGRANPGVSYLQIQPLHADSALLVRHLLECSPRPTGLYLPSDHFCGSFFRALRAAGQVPGRDFDAVLGNYNPVIYHNLDHSPAAIDVNLPTLVRQVVEHLLWRIENPDTRGRIGITVSPVLVSAAETTAPAALPHS